MFPPLASLTCLSRSDALICRDLWSGHDEGSIWTWLVDRKQSVLSADSHGDEERVALYSGRRCRNRDGLRTCSHGRMSSSWHVPFRAADSRQTCFRVVKVDCRRCSIPRTSRSKQPKRRRRDTRELGCQGAMLPRWRRMHPQKELGWKAATTTNWKPAISWACAIWDATETGYVEECEKGKEPDAPSVG